jgi:peptidyl-prolyl cis-trans isomerase C
MKSIVLTIIISVALVASTVGCSKKGQGTGSGSTDSTAASAGKGDGTVLAKVDGRPITAKDVAMQQNMLLQQIQGYADSTQIAAMLPSIKTQAMKNAVNRILLEENIKKLGIKAPKEQVDSRIDYYRKNFVSDEAFQADLKKRNMTPEQFRNEIEMGMQAEDLFNRHTAGIKPPTDKEIRGFYDGNGERFQAPERVRASHILVTVNKGESDSIRAEKRQKAQRILGELKGGADFAEEARKYSDCPSKEQGGDLGYFERGRMVPEFEKAAFALRTGQLSGIVETQFGFHIIKVTDHEKAGTVPFDQVKDNIARYLTEEKKQEALTAYFDSLRSVSNIQYFDSSFAR